MIPKIVDPNFSFTYFWEADLDHDGEYDYTSYDEDLTGIPIGVYSLNVVDDNYGCTVIYDYDLFESLTAREIFEGSIDSITHLVESSLSFLSNPYVESLSYSSLVDFSESILR